MTATNQTDDTRASDHEQAHWALQWGAQRSIRYHRRRERWLDGVNGTCGVAFAVFFLTGFTAALLLLAGDTSVLPLIAASVLGVAVAVRVAIGTLRLARVHSDLACEFADFERDLVRAGEDLSEQELREFQSRRLEIESREPPVLRVLDAMCHDELVTAHGIDPGERAEPRWYQRWFANIVDVGAHRLRKQGAR